MKVNCQYCQESLKLRVREPFDKFHVGRVICPNCDKENKRYLSELDLLIYFLGCCLFYTVGLFLIMYIIDYLFLSNTLLSVVLLAIILAVGFLGIDYLAKFIYNQAPLRNPIKNQDLKEDQKVVTRRINQQFLIFVMISLLLGTQKEMSLVYIILLLGQLITIGIRIHVAYNNEKKHTHKKQTSQQ